MPIKVYKPTSAGRRNSSVLDYSHLTKKRPEKSLVERLHRTGGRNAHGHITSRFRGGGARKLYRMIDFKRDKDDVPATVAAIEYDPNRNANIALLHYADGEKRYILAPKGVAVGQRIESGDRVEPANGNAMPLGSIPLGLEVHNVELQPGQGRPDRAFGRHVGAAPRTRRRLRHARACPSGEMRRVHVRCRATHRRGRQLRLPERALGQGRPQAPHGPPPAQPRHGDEPRRPPDGWWRGPDRRWPAPGVAGRASRPRAARRASGKARSNQFILRRRKPGKHSGGK